jgi:hypothetical protein
MSPRLAGELAPPALVPTADADAPWRTAAAATWFSMSSAVTVGKRSAGLIRAGGTVVSVVGPPEARPADGLAIDFVVEPDRGQLGEVVQRVRDGRLRTNIGTVPTLDDAVAALNPTDRVTGKTILRIRP